MDFSWSKEQESLFEAIAEFASGELNRNLMENDRNATFNREGWAKCGKFGIQGLALPQAYGGSGRDPLTTAAAMEHLGYACCDNGLVFSLSAQMLVSMPVIAFGSEEQKRRFLPGLCTGHMVGALAMSERSSGSDAYSLRTTATKKGDRYLLNGKKTFVTNGPIADMVIAFATVDESKGAPGISAFLVEKSFPGFFAGPNADKMGLRSSPMAELTFEDCEVPENNLLGAEGGGSGVFAHAMMYERGSILAGAVGSMRRLLETCIRYAKGRKQFGQPIGRFQLVGSKIVDMKLRLEIARNLLYQCGYQLGRGRKAIVEGALAKLQISEGWVKSCEDAIQIHGGYGYMTELQIERELRDAIASRIYAGTNEIQRNLVASLLI
ncbi:MAG: acyl-CoA dehydrogenase family protein [Syntrophobacteraceae bacterium]|nr:acyl-CoA dehydrogenase family protein [Syntrophobacteraceae bacterium]